MAEYRGTKAFGEKVSAGQAWSAVMGSPNCGHFQLKSDTPWFYLAVIITRNEIITKSGSPEVAT